MSEGRRNLIIALVGVLVLALFCGKGFQQGWKDDSKPKPSVTVSTSRR